jgi:anaerobic glycerol-3-phosphate dehydrogenase
MGTDGSVQDPVATYSFVISISRTDVKTNVKGGGFLQPTSQYLDLYLNVPKRRLSLLGFNGYRNFFANSLITALAPTHTPSPDPR